MPISLQDQYQEPKVTCSCYSVDTPNLEVFDRACTRLLGEGWTRVSIPTIYIVKEIPYYYQQFEKETVEYPDPPSTRETEQ